MDLVPGFQGLLQGLSPAMTAPSFASLCTIISGWMFSAGDRRADDRGGGSDCHEALFVIPPALEHRFMVARCHGAARVLDDRAVLAARLEDARPERVPGTNGRPRKRGQRLPSPADMLQGRCRLVALSIYGRSYSRRTADQVARVFAVPDRPLRIVASEALEGGRGTEAFYSTCHEATAEQVICWYAMRWSVEVAFRDRKQCLGFEEPQGWSRKAVERPAPLAMLLRTLVVLWFAKEGHRLWNPPAHRWYPGKVDPAFSDMRRTLRRTSVRQHVLAMAPSGRGSRKLAGLLEDAVAMAA